jgi:flagellin
MPLTINTNIASLNAQRNLNASQGSLATSMQRLSSGLRVNSAKDDAAGLAIAERMNAQTRGMNVAIRNANDGILMSQTAEGALSQVSNLLQRMRELAVQARNATNSSSDKDSLNKEFSQLQQEISRVLAGTTFNGKHILGADATALTFQIGANTTADDTITIATTDMSMDTTITAVTNTTTALIDASATLGAIGTVIDNIDKALDSVNDTRATYGATQSRFDSIISNLQVGVENQSAARSRIMDADFASETANMSRAQVLQQAGTAMSPRPTSSRSRCSSSCRADRSAPAKARPAGPGDPVAEACAARLFIGAARAIGRIDGHLRTCNRVRARSRPSSSPADRR